MKNAVLITSLFIIQASAFAEEKPLVLPLATWSSIQTNQQAFRACVPIDSIPAISATGQIITKDQIKGLFDDLYKSDMTHYFCVDNTKTKAPNYYHVMIKEEKVLSLRV